MVVGRGDDADWKLPDPDRVLSKSHFMVSWVDGEFVVTDTSSNGSFINGFGAPLGRGRVATLRNGDTIVAGPYEFHAEIGPAAAPPAPTMAPWEHPSDDDPFGLGALNLGAGSRPTAAAWSPPATPSDHVPVLNQPFLPRTAAGGLPDNWLDALNNRDETPSPVPSAPFAPSSSDALGRPPIPPDRPPVTVEAKPAAPPGISPDELRVTLAKALGLRTADLERTDPLEAVALVGRSLADMTDGLMALLSARAQMKAEFRIERTMVGRINNPLKFEPDAAACVARFLEGPRRGAPAPEDAIAEAFDDLKVHEIATVAAMRDALVALIERFAPDRLTERLGNHSLLQNLVPAARHASYWRLYEEAYDAIHKEAAEDLHALFGRYFAKAYTDYARQMAAKHQPTGMGKRR
jgi:type VI secretion system protein